MSKSLLFVAGLFFVNFASGATVQTCAREAEGKQSCLSGETMICIKKFDPDAKAFKYEMNAVTNQGMAISVNTPLYKKTAGYSPKPCSNAI